MDSRTHTPRAFGTLEDLDLDFANADRPQLVTSLLAQCSAPQDAEFWWQQPVSLRTAALLQLAARTDGLQVLAFSAQCSLCAETFEFELALAPLLAASSAVAPLQVQLHSRTLALRRATGNDLRDWRAARPGSRQQAVQLMLDSLLLEGEVRAEEHALLAAALADADPLAAFAVACQCPACGAEREVDIDLDAAALARLQQRQRTLLREVHSLASRYGWSEAQVLAIAPARRAQYLALIESHHE
ncbi:hypothetical protein ACVW0Y_001127 [Pseudomonas sp. TE3786]